MRPSSSTTTSPSAAVSAIALVRSLRAPWPLNWTAPIAIANRKNTPAMPRSARSSRISGWARSGATKLRLSAAPTRSAAKNRSSPTRPGRSERSIDAPVGVSLASAMESRGSSPITVMTDAAAAARHSRSLPPRLYSVRQESPRRGRRSRAAPGERRVFDHRHPVLGSDRPNAQREPVDALRDAERRRHAGLVLQRDRIMGRIGHDDGRLRDRGHHALPEPRQANLAQARLDLGAAFGLLEFLLQLALRHALPVAPGDALIKRRRSRGRRRWRARRRGASWPEKGSRREARRDQAGRMHRGGRVPTTARRRRPSPRSRS